MKINRFLNKDNEKSLLFISENVIVFAFSYIEPVTKHIMYILIKSGLSEVANTQFFCSTTLFLFSRMRLLLGLCLKPVLVASERSASTHTIFG